MDLHEGGGAEEGAALRAALAALGSAANMMAAI